MTLDEHIADVRERIEINEQQLKERRIMAKADPSRWNVGMIETIERKLTELNAVLTELESELETEKPTLSETERADILAEKADRHERKLQAIYTELFSSELNDALPQLREVLIDLPDGKQKQFALIFFDRIEKRIDSAKQQLY